MIRGELRSPFAQRPVTLLKRSVETNDRKATYAMLAFFAVVLSFFLGSYLYTRFEVIPQEKAQILKQMALKDSTSVKIASMVLDCSFEKAFLKESGSSSRSDLMNAEKHFSAGCADEVSQELQKDREFYMKADGKVQDILSRM